MEEKEMLNCLQLFSQSTSDWFQEALGCSTPVQEAAWPAIAQGAHVLVSAPTGTGTTLSANENGSGGGTETGIVSALCIAA